jgi:hypothetical protein
MGYLCRYLDSDISESRDIKLCELLDTKGTRWILLTTKSCKNMDVVLIISFFIGYFLKFYSINGFLTIKQLDSVRRMINM